METQKDAETIISNSRKEQTYTYALALCHSNYIRSTVSCLEIVEYTARKCVKVRYVTLRYVLP